MSTLIGRQAEAVAAGYLQTLGFSVLEQNWRTRWCEIDIVARHEGRLYFVEVKYRRQTTWGSGLDYITARKMRQMQFAASFWTAQHSSTAVNYSLSAIELSGEPAVVTGWIPSIQ